MCSSHLLANFQTTSIMLEFFSSFTFVYLDLFGTISTCKSAIISLAIKIHNLGLSAASQGRIQDFFSRGCTRLLLYFNTNRPHSFFLQNTSCIRKPQVISGGGVRTPCTLPLDPPLLLIAKVHTVLKNLTWPSITESDRMQNEFYPRALEHSVFLAFKH